MVANLVLCSNFDKVLKVLKSFAYAFGKKTFFESGTTLLKFIDFRQQFKEPHPHFRPKSAGISPQTLVSHLTMGVLYELFFSQSRARRIKSKSAWFLAVSLSFVLQVRFRTQLRGGGESLWRLGSLFFCFRKASPCTSAKNSP